MITTIERSTIWTADKDNFSAFHPRCCVDRQGGQSKLLMTVQEISGSDYFHGVKWAESVDGGRTWSLPQDIDALQWVEHDDGISEGVCDVIPEYHRQTDTILAIGHNVFYRDGHLLDTMGDFNRGDVGDQRRIQRYPVYVVRTPDGQWSERKKLCCPPFDQASIYTCNCSQRVHLDKGDLLIPMVVGTWGRFDRQVCSVRFSYDGQALTFLEAGNMLELPAGRGLLEPQMVRFGGRFYLSLRAEDDHGHVSVSDDGLNWQEIRPWCWDDGEPLTMSSTQQHWLELNGKLYLLYTRKADNNTQVIRWRAPLFVAQVDPDRLCLIRQSEQVVFELEGDGVNDGKRVPTMGNFHPIPLGDQHAIVTVGAWRTDLNKTNTLIAWLS